MITSIELIKGLANDVKTPYGKVIFLRTFQKDKNKVDSICCVCNKELSYVPDRLYEIKEVSCLKCEANWIPAVEFIPSEKKAAKPVCPKCNGLAYYSGFKHYQNCPDYIEIKEKNHCDECNGIKKGRGFKHMKNCSKKITKE